MSRRSAPAHRGSQGQALTEMALIVPILALFVLAIVEFAGGFSAKTDLQAASAQGARIGALDGNGNVVSCPSTTPITDTIDQSILNTITTTRGINPSSIQQVQIFKAAADGTIALITSTAPYTPLVDTYTLSGGAVTSSFPLYWPSCARNPNEPSDSIGIRVTYRYVPILKLPLFPNFTMTDQTVERLNPTKSALPCPIPGIPTNVYASPASPEPPPTASDTISWDWVPGAQGYYVYNSVGLQPFGSTPILTVAAGAPNARVQATYAGNSTFGPATYLVKGYNSCGIGEGSLLAVNHQCPLPTAPTILTATALLAPPNTDDVSWTSGIVSGTYALTQTVPLSGTNAFSVTAPLTVATVTAPSSITVTYSVAATNGCGVQGVPSLEATRVPLPPTPTSTPSPTSTPTSTSTSASTATTTNTSLAPTATATNTSVAAATATQTPVPTATPDLTTGLVGQWNFSAGSGPTIADGSGRSNDGSWLGTPRETTVQGWSTAGGSPFGPADYYGHFDGNRYIVAGVNGMPAISGTMSISLWMRFSSVPSGANGNANMLALNNSGQGKAVQVGFRSGQLSAWAYGGTPYLQLSASATSSLTSTTTWHNLIYTYDGVRNESFYIDGGATPVVTGTVTQQAAATTALAFGDYAGDGSPSPPPFPTEVYTGDLDDIRIYNLVLSQAQRAALQTTQ